jgi:hypothetical protein
MNPYAPPTAVGTMEPTGEAWPYDLPLATSRRVRRIAWDTDHAALSLVGALFLGAAGPIVFTVFFVAHWWSHVRLTRRYPDLLLSSNENPVAKSFANARGKLRAWACIYGSFLIVEIAWLTSLFFP